MSEKKVVMRIRALHKRFGAQSVLQGIDLDIYAGEKIAIIGGSGSGKSTLLRCLNFMEIPSAGTVELDGVTLGKIDSRGQRRYSEKQLSDVRQRVGMVFQQFNLFPHLTVLQNVSEALISVKKMRREEAMRIAHAQLEKVGLGHKHQAWPGSLSGGQQQRVLLARALCATRKMLLLDEPVSGLDPKVTAEMYHLIETLNRQEGITVLMISHDIRAAVCYASHILHIGESVFFGTREEYLQSPQGRLFAAGKGGAV